MASHLYTETTIETAFRATIGDPSSNPAQRWNSAQCIDYMNRGAGQLILDVPNSLETYWDITTADGTREYSLPGDFIAHKRVEYHVDTDDHRLLKYMDETSWREAHFPDDKTSTGEPQFYTYLRALGAPEDAEAAEQPRFIVLEPTPDAAKTLRVRGYKLMEALVAGNTDVPELATPKLEAVIYYGCHLAMLDDENENRARMFLTLYERQVNKILSFRIDEAAGFDEAPRMKPWNHGRIRGPVLPWERGYY